MKINLDHLFFYPDSNDHGGYPLNDGFEFDRLMISSSNNVKLNGWYIKSPERQNSKATIIHFHGNAGNITNHWCQVSWALEQGFDVITFDYRGYGFSTGKASFPGIFSDCCHIIEYARNNKKIVNKKIIIFGQSLGGLFAICASSIKYNHDIIGFIIDSSFGNKSDIVMDKLKLPKNKFFSTLTSNIFSLDDRINGEACIEKIPSKKIFIHSLFDKIVPYSSGLKLYNKSPEPKLLITLEDNSSNYNHINFFSERKGGKWNYFIKQLNEYLV